MKEGGERSQANIKKGNRRRIEEKEIRKSKKGGLIVHSNNRGERRKKGIINSLLFQVKLIDISFVVLKNSCFYFINLSYIYVSRSLYF